MIEINNLVKYYGSIKAVDGISFKVNEGEIVGFLGPNGAGKSTTMNILTGYLSATSGSVKVNGHDILEDPREAKRSIGYLPEQPPIYLEMTVLEYLRFVADLKSVPKKEQAAHLGKIMKSVRITHVMKRRIGNLSKGYRQRVGIAQALISNPEVIVLDEPTIGLDPKQIIEIRETIKDLGREHTIILSSHILSEVSATCDRVIIINQGKLAAIDNAAILTRKDSLVTGLELVIDGPVKDVIPRLRQIAGVMRVDNYSRQGDKYLTCQVHSEEDRDVRRELFYEMARNAWPILSMRSLEPTLEDIFLSVTGDGNAYVSAQTGGKQ